MKRLNVIVLGILLSLSTSGLQAAEYVAGEVIVKFRADSPFSEGLAPNQPVIVNVANTAQALQSLNERSDVEYAEPNYLITAEATPNDWPHTTAIWTHLDLPQAYDFFMNPGAPATSIVVAVIDSGCDTDHPDLVNRIVNPLNFIDQATPSSVGAQDDSGHGTQVAGLITAQGDNANGMAGLAWAGPAIKVMPLKFMQLQSDGKTSGSMYNATRAIRYAADHGARIINASWGIYSYSQALADAVSYARERGVAFVCSAGNGNGSNNIGQDNDSYAHYPSNLKLDNLISVAALGSANALASFSNWGHYGVDLAAPGENLTSTTINGYTNNCDGTSFAAPCVSAVAALVLAREPALTASALRERLMATSYRPSDGSIDQRLSEAGGILNANNALQNTGTHAIDSKAEWTPPAAQSAADNSGQSTQDGGGGGGGTCFVASCAMPPQGLLLAVLGLSAGLLRRRRL